MAVSYPADLPGDSVAELIRIVRAGTIVEERGPFAHAIWNVQGFAQKLLLGDVPAAGKMPELAELCEVLEAMPPTAPEAFPIWLLPLIQALIAVLRELFAK